MTQETVYDPNDIVWLSRGIPLGLLMGASQAIYALRGTAQIVADMERILASEEEIWSEPMEAAHACMRCMGAYDEDMRGDLLIRSTHRKMVTLGGLLTFLSPREDDLAVLEQSAATVGDASWIIDMSLRHLRGEQVVENREHLLLLLSIREALSALDIPRTRLRRFADAPRDDLADLRERMRMAYADEGADAAHALLTRAEAEDSALGRYLTHRLMPRE